MATFDQLFASSIVLTLFLAHLDRRLLSNGGSCRNSGGGAILPETIHCHRDPVACPYTAPRSSGHPMRSAGHPGWSDRCP